MKQFYKSLFEHPRTATLLLSSSLIITLLALLPAFYVILVLNKFLASGVVSTLVTLTVGTVLAVAFEFVFRQNRQTLLSKFLQFQSNQLLLAMKDKMQKEKSMTMEVSKALQIVDVTNKQSAMSSVLDMPFQLIFIILVATISWQLSMILIVFILILFLLNKYQQVFAFKESTTAHMDITLNSLLTVSIIGLGSYLAVNSAMSVGSLIGVNILATRSFMAVNKYLKVNKLIEKRYESINELHKFVDIK